MTIFLLLEKVVFQSVIDFKEVMSFLEEMDIKKRFEKATLIINREIHRIELGEKMRAGAALADFNGNGIDDIVIGTDDENIYLIYDVGI